MTDKPNTISDGLTLCLHVKGHRRPINLIAWSHDGNLLASASDDTTIGIWGIDGNLRRSLKGHTFKVVCVDWAPDSKHLVSGADDGAIMVWDTQEIAQPRKLTRFEKTSVETGIGRELASIMTIAWSPHGRYIASGASDGSVLLWDSETNEVPRTIEARADIINRLAWSPDGKILALATATGARLWNQEIARPRFASSAYASEMTAVTWSRDGQVIAFGSSDSTIRIWDSKTGREINVIEGHAGAITDVDFSADGKMLASRAKDNFIRLWQRDSWEPLIEISEPAHRFAGIKFHPQRPILAAVDQRGSSIKAWQIDHELLIKLASSIPTRRYANAKVVLVGDSGVGKSGLGLVLSGHRFVPTESTHGRHVWDFENLELELAGTRQRETRQTLLWDLAGQPGYRLIHQLHLNEVAVALIVFDARSETDPLSGVRHWDRSLRQASLLSGADGLPIRKFLVAARMDRGSIGISRGRIDAFLGDFDFERYFETSAKDGWGIPELAEAIREAIDWDSLPRVNSTELFHRIKEFLIDEKNDGRLLSSIEDLYRSFIKIQLSTDSPTNLLRPQFETCIGLLESRGLVQRLSFGNLVLLQPEILDAYASAIVNTAKEEPDGLGSIAEESIRSGRFRLASDERIKDLEQEKLLLIATVEALLRHEIALREETGQGALLVFPSQLTRENPALPDPVGKAVVFTFEGPLLNIYATLAVRLSHSGIFRKKEMWRNAATYAASAGGTCGVFLREIEEGRGELTLFFDEEASEQIRFQFEEFIYSHLIRRAIPESLLRRRVFVCPSCSTPVTELQVSRRIERGYNWIECNVCGESVLLADREERLSLSELPLLTEMERTANDRRGREMATMTLQGKIESADYDVFLCHVSGDRYKVREIGQALRMRGLLPWFDEWEARPGQRWQQVLAKQIGKIKSVAVFVGPSGIGPWQDQEVRSMLRLFAERQVSIIPVLLEGAEQFPTLPIFFERLSWIDFRVDPVQGLDTLIWGITGERSAGR